MRAAKSSESHTAVKGLVLSVCSTRHIGVLNTWPVRLWLSNPRLQSQLVFNFEPVLSGFHPSVALQEGSISKQTFPGLDHFQI